MPIIKCKRTSNFLTMSKKALDDPDLSWKAKGLLAYLLSRPPQWIIRTEHLKTVSTDGADSVRTGLRQLKASGYAKIHTERDKDGKITSRYWMVYETRTLLKKRNVSPQTGFSLPRFCPTKENPTLVSIDSSKELKIVSPPAERDGLDKSSFLVNGESSLFKACDKYRQFLVRNPAIRITSYIVKERWMPCAKDFLQRYLHNDQDTFISTLDWYIKNAEKEKYLPDCQNMSQFCRRFASIRKQMMTQLEDAPYHIEVKRTGPIEVVEDDAPAFEEP